MNFFEHKTYIHCRVPRIKCKEHNVTTVKVPWSNGGSGFTILFEEFVMKLDRNRPVLSISKLLQESNGKIWRIIKKYANKYVKELEFSKVRKIGIDEWISWALRSKLEPFKNAVRIIGRKLEGIINYFENRITNAV